MIAALSHATARRRIGTCLGLLLLALAAACAGFEGLDLGPAFPAGSGMLGGGMG